MFREYAPRWKSLLQLERAFDRCPRCGRLSSVITNIDSGEMCCSGCGFVVRDGAIDQGPDWHRIDDGEAPARRGGERVSRVMGDVGRSTKMGNGGRVNEEMNRLIMRDSWTKIGRGDKGLNDARHAAEGLADRLALPNSIVERTVQIYRKAFAAGLLRKRPGRRLAAAALYAACRESNIPRSAGTMAEASGADLKLLLSDYRILVEKLDLKMPAPDPASYIGGIVSRTGLTERTRRRAMAVFGEFSKSGEGLGKSPLSRAAGAVCVACHLEGEPKSQAELARAAGISEYTVRAAAKEILSTLNLRVSMRKLSPKSR